MIRLKPGVSLDNVHPRVYLIIGFAGPIWARYGSPDLWVTGGNESGHSTGPRGFHRLPDGTCQAVDLRTWTIPVLADRYAATNDLAAMLAPIYDVLYEKPGQRGEHAHCQYDPDRVGTSL